MKIKKKRILSLILAVSMMICMMPAMSMTAFAYTEGDISGTTGIGTESDPVIVDTYAEMKAALECEDDLYIKVVGFDHTTTAGGRTYRELVAGTDYTPGMNQGAIIIPSGKTKHLTIATDIICYAEAATEANSMWTFIHNLGTLYIDGTGKLAVNFNATSQWYGINAIVLNRGELEVSGSVTFDATQDSATPTTAFAIANGNGNTAHTKIYGGTFIASNNSNGALSYGNCYAVGADDGYIWIFGGEFRATPSGTGTGYGIGGSYGNVLLIGGTFEGVYMSPVGTQGKYLSDFLSEGDGVVYRTETGAAFDGSTIKKTTEKVRVVKSEKIITGPVEVSVTAPVAGNTPAMTATTTTANVQSNPACCWYPLDENGNIIISGMLGEADTFEAGKNYAVGVVLLPAEGYEFADTTVVNINGGVAEKSLPTSYKSIQATCYFASEIKAVNMTVSAPEIGKTPNDMTNTYTATGLASGTFWFYASANASGAMMNGSTAFAGENTYSAIYQFKIPDSSNAQFASTITTSDITVNNGTVYAVNRISDKEIQVTVNFPTLHEDIIDEVNMTVSAPEIGKTPNDMTHSATGLTPGAYWFYASANASGSIMSGDTAFVSGNTYSAIYQFTIPDGSAAKFAETIGTGDITVNNGTVYAVYRAGDKKIEVTVNFGELKDDAITIDTIAVTVTVPVAGAAPVVEPAGLPTGVTCEPVSTTAAGWYDSETNAKMASTDTFIEGKTYYIRLFLSADTGYAFANPVTTAKINGDAAIIELNTEQYLGIKKSFTATAASATEYDITVTDGTATIGAGTEISKAEEGTEVTLTAATAPTGKVFDKWEVVSGSITLADANSATTTFIMPADAVSVRATYKDTYTVSFDANGGTGTMTAVTVVSGDSFTLPANGFTAPAGKQFKAWSVGGVEKAVGDKITVTADTTVTAVWKTIPAGYIPTVQKPEIVIIGSGKAPLSADGTVATITADEGYELVSVVLNGKDMGKVDKLTGLKTGDKAVITFQKKADDSAAEVSKLVAKIGNLQLVARSNKTAKKNVNVVLKMDDSTKAVIQGIENLGYTVKYKFYRSTKRSSGYKAMLLKAKPQYTNTIGEKGTMYYYKARVMVYDKDGNLIAKTELKQCKYANRLWTK